MPSNTANRLDSEIAMTARFIVSSLSVLLFLFLAITASHTFASSWTEVPGGRNGGMLIEYDPGTISPLPNGANVTWRTWRQSSINNRGDFFELYESEINCKEFYIHHNRQSDIFWSSGRVFRSHDFSGENLQALSFDFPFWDNNTGLLVRAVCRKVVSNWDELWPSEQESKTECNNSQIGTDHQTCSNLRIQGGVKLLTHRTAFVAARCSNSIEDAKRVLIYTLNKAGQCDTNECSIRVINGLLSSFSRDLRAAHLGNPCSAVASELKIIAEEEKKAKENEERQGALRSYLSCAKNAVAVVDDLSSGADIVAIAAHSKCVEIFNHATKGLSSNATTIIEKQLRPKLIEFVFDWRRQIRISPKQPKSPEKAPDNYKRIM